VPDCCPPPLVLWPLPPVAAVAAVGAAAAALALVLVGARFFLLAARGVAVAGAARLRACVAFAAADCLFPPGLRT
jgi:hypothetical protein